MEKGQCLMWTKRKYSVSSNYLSSYDDDSWEEKAFAKDAAAGSDCIWPPRSYSCSFCRREFKSAQALGGHMNVHRRDRARLKQPSSPQNEILCHDLETTHPHNQAQNSLASLGNYLYQTGLDYSTNPNSDNPSDHVLPSPSMVLPREKTMIPLYNSSVLQETSPADSSKSWSNLAEDCRLYSSKFDPEAGVEKNLKGLDSDCRSVEENSDKTDMAMNLNLFVCKAHPSVQFETKETDIGFKKRKTDASSNSFFSRSSLVDRHHMQSQMFGFSPNSIEELDLELRLGYRHKV